MSSTSCNRRSRHCRRGSPRKPKSSTASASSAHRPRTRSEIYEKKKSFGSPTGPGSRSSKRWSGKHWRGTKRGEGRGERRRRRRPRPAGRVPRLVGLMARRLCRMGEVSALRGASTSDTTTAAAAAMTTTSGALAEALAREENPAACTRALVFIRGAAAAAPPRPTPARARRSARNAPTRTPPRLLLLHLLLLVRLLLNLRKKRPRPPPPLPAFGTTTPRLSASPASPRVRARLPPHTGRCLRTRRRRPVRCPAPASGGVGRPPR